jgi:hypothetical protein
MIDLDFGILVNRPGKDVFTFESELKIAPPCQSQLVPIPQVSNRSMEVRSCSKSAGEMMGHRMDGNAEITVYEPESKFGFVMEAGLIQMKVMAAFKPAGSRTQFKLNARGERDEVFKLAEGHLIDQVRTLRQTSLDRLEAFLESGERMPS